MKSLTEFAMVDGKTALVTGGGGFIGSHMVDRLLALGYRVVIIGLRSFHLELRRTIHEIFQNLV